MKSNDNNFLMAGTERTFQYIVLLVTSLGRIGVRTLSGGGTYRVRVEPTDQSAATSLAPSFPYWKQPDSQFRFSTMVTGGIESLTGVLTMALTALMCGDSHQVNPDCPDFARELIASLTTQTAPAAQPAMSKETMLALAMSLGIPGANCRWKSETLAAKLDKVPAADLHAALVAEVRDRQLPGCNFAILWKTETLTAKLG